MLENNNSNYENAESKLSNSGENIIINSIKNSNNVDENNDQLNINYNYNKDYYFNKITNSGNENNRYSQENNNINNKEEQDLKSNNSRRKQTGPIFETENKKLGYCSVCSCFIY